VNVSLKPGNYGIVLAITEIAYVAGELVAVREAGFTAEALKYRRSRLGFIALCAWNGADPSTAPRGWRYAPNKWTLDAWERVVEAIGSWENA
jgi:hypothetical protein